ncbi:hypothetical protein BX666DRAFT_1408315 [Dichotomocladium elegans]|nr:hypothetical protein BX666DRAFT_1408315 [Dichotomocladium elegans]
MSQLQPSKRSAPHVVFLIDIVQDYSDGQEATVRWIQHMILRILLFFLDSVDKRTTWGYRFFSSNTCSIAMSNQSFRSISNSSIQAFREDFVNRIASSNNNTTSNGPSSQPTAEEAPFAVVNRNLVQTLAEFHWSDIDLASESPRRQQQQQQQWNRTHTMDVKNFTYLVTRAPHNVPALRTYLPPEMTLDDSLPLLDQVAQGLKKMHAELRKWLWEDYVYHRISLTWIDTGSFDTSSANDDTNAQETWICNGISSILRPFGGCHLNAAMLTEEYARFGLSFGAIFRECTQTKVEMTADTVTPMTADELVISSKYPSPVWIGTLIPHSDDHPPMQVKLYPESKHYPRPENIAAMEMIRTLYRSQFQLKWLSRTQRSIYVLAGDEAFASLMTELEKCHRLALVRLAFVSFDDVQYAIMDPKVTNTAVLRLLASDFEMSNIKPAGTLSMYRKRSFDGMPLDYLELPVTPAKRARLSKALGDTVKTEKAQAPLSESHIALVEHIRKKRQARREQLEAATETSHNSQSQMEVSSPVSIKEEAASFHMPRSVGELQIALRNIYFNALYTNKVYSISGGTFL